MKTTHRTPGKRSYRYLFLCLLCLLPMAGAWGQGTPDGSKDNPYVIDLSYITPENAEANGYTCPSSNFIECTRGGTSADAPVYYKLVMSYAGSSGLYQLIYQSSDVPSPYITFLIDGTVRMGYLRMKGTVRIEKTGSADAVLDIESETYAFIVENDANVTIGEGVKVVATVRPAKDWTRGGETAVTLMSSSTLTNNGTLSAIVDGNFVAEKRDPSSAISTFQKARIVNGPGASLSGYGRVHLWSDATITSSDEDNSILSFGFDRAISANTIFRLMKDGEAGKEITVTGDRYWAFFSLLPAGTYTLLREDTDDPGETVPLQGRQDSPFSFPIQETFTVEAGKASHFLSVSPVCLEIDLANLSEGPLRDDYGRVEGDRLILTKPGGHYLLSGDGSGKTLSIETGDTPESSVTLWLPLIVSSQPVHLKQITIPETTRLGSLRIKRTDFLSRLVLDNTDPEGTAFSAAHLGKLFVSKGLYLNVFGKEYGLDIGGATVDNSATLFANGDVRAIAAGSGLTGMGLTFRTEAENGFPEGVMGVYRYEEGGNPREAFSNVLPAGCREIFVASPNISKDYKYAFYLAESGTEGLYALCSDALDKLSETGYTNVFEYGKRYLNVSRPLDLRSLPAGHVYLTCDGGVWHYATTPGAATPAGYFCGRIVDTSLGDSDPLPYALSVSLRSDGLLAFDCLNKLAVADGPTLDISRPSDIAEAVTLGLSTLTHPLRVEATGETNPALRVGSGVTCLFDEGESFWQRRLLLCATSDKAVELAGGDASVPGLRMFGFDKPQEKVTIYGKEGVDEPQVSAEIIPSSSLRSFAVSLSSPLTVWTEKWEDNGQQNILRYSLQYRGTKTLPTAGSDPQETFAEEPDKAFAAYALRLFALQPENENLMLTFNKSSFGEIEVVRNGNDKTMSLNFESDRELTFENYKGDVSIKADYGGEDPVPANVRLTLRGENRFGDIALDPQANLTLRHEEGATTELSELTLYKSGGLSTDRKIDAPVWMDLEVHRGRWNTIGLPVSMSLRDDGITYNLREGFTGAGNQRWEEESGNGLSGKIGYIIAPEKDATGEQSYCVTLSSENIAGASIPADGAVEFPTGLADGEFRFMANPHFHPLTLADIYTLSADGTRFELHEEEVTVETGRAFMVANAVTRRSLRSIGIGAAGDDGSIATGIQTALPDGSFRVWGSRGEMHLSASRPSDVKIVSLSGSVLHAFRLDGDRALSLSSGIYLVVCDGVTYKVVL